ncbi:MAG TPA: pyrimidine dimer DNA glycosylase/endonuclease V [Chthonomonadaceae bacterium]|nr:pyrimidine dimer DNA glycosylase/endonuclease V [Chthonomonadaceae bacterium]
MQVFLPFADFAESARVLDKRRLQRQGVEGLQLLLSMFDVPLEDGRARTGHKNHPCYTGWAPYRLALIKYTLAVVEECKARGVKADTVEGKVRALIPEGCGLEHVPLPPFVGDEAFHRSHRYRLLQKGKEDAAKGGTDWYAQFLWEEANDPNLDAQSYLWPIYLPGSTTEYRLELRGG